MFDVLRCLVEHENGYRTHAINLQDYEGSTVLHLALGNDCSDSLLQYLSNAVNVSIANKKGETSLQAAVLNGHSEEVIHALLGSRHGTEAANVQNALGETALHTAVLVYDEDDDDDEDDEDDGDDEDEDDDDDEDEDEDKDKDDEEIVRALSRVTNVNAQDREGKTALHYAIKIFEFALMNILLYEQKTNLCLQDYEGNTPLSFACELRTDNAHSQLSIIFLLYQYGIAYGERMV